ncbi:hypothetical protein [uncultured Roseivirga sp.]|uniref:hypothetical protein n=1 Tax=uncultured Roseivirga sp. TaxID=543088 RepID=UPI002590D96A|nr:hypothetical protein [uncultured Roseivirga sp.]
MQKRLLPLLSLLLVIWGCGEAGFQSDISKNVEIDPINVQLSVPAIFVGQDIDETPPIDASTGVIDISDNEFSDYLDDATKFTINKISYSIVNFPSGSRADLDMDIDVAIAGGQNQDLLEILIADAQNNVEDVILYEAGTPGNVSAIAIQDLEQALFNSQTFELDIEIIGRDVNLSQSDVDFQIVFKFDVTTRLQLD